MQANQMAPAPEKKDEQSDADRTKLEREKNELEAAIMGMAAENIEVPAHVAERFEHLRTLLNGD